MKTCNTVDKLLQIMPATGVEARFKDGDCQPVLAWGLYQVEHYYGASTTAEDSYQEVRPLVLQEDGRLFDVDPGAAEFCYTRGDE